MFLIPEIQFTKINDNEYFMVNLINAAADIINSDVYKMIKNNTFSGLNNDIISTMKARRYLFDSKDDYNNFIKQLNESIKHNEEN